MQCEIAGCPLPAGRALRRPGGATPSGRAELVVCSSCAEDLVGVFGYDLAQTAPRLATAQPAGV